MSSSQEAVARTESQEADGLDAGPLAGLAASTALGFAGLLDHGVRHLELEDSLEPREDRDLAALGTARYQLAVVAPRDARNGLARRLGAAVALLLLDQRPRVTRNVLTRRHVDDLELPS